MSRHDVTRKSAANATGQQVDAARPGPTAKAAGYPGAMPRPAHYETPTVRIDKLIVGPVENNVFVVRCTGTGEAVIILA